MYVLTMDGIPITEITKREASNIKAEFPEIKSCIDIDIMPPRRKFYNSEEGTNTATRKKFGHDGKSVYESLLRIMESGTPRCSFATHLMRAGYVERIRTGHYILTHRGRIHIKIHENFNNNAAMYEAAVYIKEHPGATVKKMSYNSHYSIRTLNNIFNKLVNMGYVSASPNLPRLFYWIGDDSLLEIDKEGD